MCIIHNGIHTTWYIFIQAALLVRTVTVRVSSPVIMRLSSISTTSETKLLAHPAYCTHLAIFMSFNEQQQLSTSFSVLRRLGDRKAIWATKNLCHLFQKVLSQNKGPKRGWRSSLHDLDLGLSQSHISMHNTYRTTSTPDHVTLGSSNTDIWPLESPVISTFVKFEVTW